MTKDKALKLALEAGYKDLPIVRLAYQGFDIQHFTNLVIADERHRVLSDERAAITQAIPQIPQEHSSNRQWVGLTEWEREAIAIECGAMSADWLVFIKAVERALKEKNT